MLTTIHLADLGALGTARTVARRLRTEHVPGLRWGTTALPGPLAASGPPPLDRAAVIALWDDEAAIDAFVADHPIGRRFADGFEARLRPLRAHGAWPGLPDDVPTARNVPHDGPVVVVTMSWLRLSRLPRFVRTSRPAEQAALVADGMLWGSTAIRLPFAATMSVWRDGRAAATYAYQRSPPAHPAAIDEDRRRTFNRRSAFVRYAPVRVRGRLPGADASVTDLLAGAQGRDTEEARGT